MRAELAGEHFDSVPGRGDPEGRAVVQKLFQFEAFVEIASDIAPRMFDHIRIGGESALRQQGGVDAFADGVTAIGRFRHRADIGEDAPRPRGDDTDGATEFLDIEADHVTGSDGRAERADEARWMKADRLDIVLMRGFANPTHDLDAFDHRGQAIPTIRLPLFRERQNRRQRGRDLMVRGLPHRLEVEYVHGGAVHVRGFDG